MNPAGSAWWIENLWVSLIRPDTRFMFKRGRKREKSPYGATRTMYPEID